MKKITIATVCYNADKTIAKTINSVINQSFDDYEYLIIDGKSNDKTLEIIKSYDDAFKEKNISYKVISEKDNGIFDAMNKAASLAEGKWIIYMNADDEFYNDDVLKNINKFLNDDYDVVYGNTMRVKGIIKEFAPAKDFEVIYKGMPFCHQSVFTKTAIMREYKFDLKYRVADYNFFLNLALANKKFLKTDITIANYSVEGYSNKNKYKTYQSILDIKHDLGLINKNSLKQKLKNVYFHILLDENKLLHKFVCKIDKSIHGKR